ncbi:ABC transporter permease [Ligilactobacillus sp. LYQ139]|uniref:ABC transporter permease n=1 Tax=Ligilactobacillus sp. LYQ139 TaxID=3378800 RepID=UPI0038552CCF
MVNIFRAEFIKNKRSSILWLHLFALVAFPIILGVYYGVHVRCTAQIAVKMYYQLVSLMTPLVISIIITIVNKRESKAGHFKNLISVPTRKERMLNEQLFFYIVLYLIVILGSSIIYWGVFSKLSGGFLLKGIVISLFMWILSISQYEIYRIIAYVFSNGITLLLGIIGSFTAVLGNTVLFDKFWFLIPWIWQGRLAVFYSQAVPVSILKMYAMQYILCLIITLFIYIVSNVIFKKKN